MSLPPEITVEVYVPPFSPGSGIVVTEQPWDVAVAQTLPPAPGPVPWFAVSDKPDSISAVAGLSPAPDTVVVFTGEASASLATLTPFARVVIGSVDAEGMRVALGLGNSAVRDVGTSTGTVAAGDDPRIVNAVPATRQIVAGNGLTGGGALSSDITLALAGQALALHNLATNGFFARVGTGLVVSRALTAGANISITNPDGVNGNPVIAVVGLAPVALSGSASDLTTGSLSLARLAQGGAQPGQVLTWNGAQWVPQTLNAGPPSNVVSTETGDPLLTENNQMLLME